MSNQAERGKPPMIELGTDEHYLAIYHRGATNDTFQCALDLTYGDLHAWYEPVYFARADVQRCVQELSAVIDVRRTIVGLKVAKPTVPGIELILTPSRAGSADYRLRLNVEQERAGMLLEPEHATVTLDVSHTNLMTAFGILRRMLPDALDTPVRPQLIDLGGIEVGGCLFHCPSHPSDQPRLPKDDVVGYLVDVQLEGMSMSYCEKEFFASTLEQFATEAEDVAQGDTKPASLRSLDQRFYLELVSSGSSRRVWAKVEMRAHVSDLFSHHEDVLTGGYAIRPPVIVEAARTMRALLRAEGLLDEQRHTGG